MFVCLTGYGKITPKTSLGQGITIAICLFRIPISMFAFKTAGELVASLLRYTLIKTETVLLKRWTETYQEENVPCCEFISSCPSHIVCRVGHLLRGMEFYDQLIRLVYYLYNNWFWRLCSLWGTSKKAGSRGSLCRWRNCPRPGPNFAMNG